MAGSSSTTSTRGEAGVMTGGESSYPEGGTLSRETDISVLLQLTPSPGVSRSIAARHQYVQLCDKVTSLEGTAADAPRIGVVAGFTLAWDPRAGEGCDTSSWSGMSERE